MADVKIDLITVEAHSPVEFRDTTFQYRGESKARLVKESLLSWALTDECQNRAGAAERLGLGGEQRTRAFWPREQHEMPNISWEIASSCV